MTLEHCNYLAIKQLLASLSVENEDIGTFIYAMKIAAGVELKEKYEKISEEELHIVGAFALAHLCGKIDPDNIIFSDESMETAYEIFRNSYFNHRDRCFDTE